MNHFMKKNKSKIIIRVVLCLALVIIVKLHQISVSSNNDIFSLKNIFELILIIPIAVFITMLFEKVFFKERSKKK